MSSSCGMMDGVPMKIAEKYKPQPSTYRVTQEVAKHLQLPEQYYCTSKEYSYDFQLERKVLTKIPEWRHMRRLKHEARQQRREQSEQQRLRNIELQQKQLLGAVSYPSAEDLSSSSVDSEEDEMATAKQTKISNSNEHHISNDQMPTPATTTTTPVRISTTTITSFHNILQPTILSSVTLSEKNANADKSHGSASTAERVLNNFDDFEVITASPFDNIELKTINDLDMLAQVLKSAKELAITSDTQHEITNGAQEEENSNQEEAAENENEQDKSIVGQAVANLTLIANTKAALEKVNFNDLHDQYNHHNHHLQQQQQQHENIPQHNSSYNTSPQQQQQQAAPINADAYYHSNNQQLLTATYMPYSSQHHHSTGQQQHFQNHNLSHLLSYDNRNYLNNSNTMAAAAATHSHYQYQPTYFVANNYENSNFLLHNNGGTNTMNTAISINDGDHQQLNSSSNYLPANAPAAAAIQEVNAMTATTETGDTGNDHCESSLSTKSKSVPDILKELTEEIHNSKMRRTRKYSHSNATAAVTADDADVDADPDESSNVGNNTNSNTKPLNTSDCSTPIPRATSLYYDKLDVAAQQLTKNISSMGFPLERVAMIAQKFGADDKKIIEHLIPLSELMDLGFDEMQISEALLKYDNNKDKALEHLIS